MGPNSHFAILAFVSPCPMFFHSNSRFSTFFPKLTDLRVATPPIERQISSSLWKRLWCSQSINWLRLGFLKQVSIDSCCQWLFDSFWDDIQVGPAVRPSFSISLYSCLLFEQTATKEESGLASQQLFDLSKSYIARKNATVSPAKEHTNDCFILPDEKKTCLRIERKMLTLIPQTMIETAQTDLLFSALNSHQSTQKEGAKKKWISSDDDVGCQKCVLSLSLCFRRRRNAALSHPQSKIENFVVPFSAQLSHPLNLNEHFSGRKISFLHLSDFEALVTGIWTDSGQPSVALQIQYKTNLPSFIINCSPGCDSFPLIKASLMTSRPSWVKERQISIRTEKPWMTKVSPWCAPSWLSWCGFEHALVGRLWAWGRPSRGWHAATGQRREDVIWTETSLTASRAMIYDRC